MRFKGELNRDTRLITLALFLWGIGEGLFIHIQPLYIEQLGANPVQIGGLLSTMAMVSALTFVPAGLLADRLPRKWFMWGGWVLGVGGSLLVSMAHTWQHLLPGLLIYALSSYCMPVINAYVAYSVNGRNLERTFTTVFAGYAAGGLLSPPIGGWLASLTTMRTVYYTATAIFTLSALLMLRVAPQPIPPRAGPGRQAEARGVWRSLLNRRFIRFAGATWLVFAAIYLSFPLTPNFLADVRKWDVSRIGALGSFQALGMTCFTLLLGRLADWNRAGGLLVGQMLVWGSALLLLATGAFPALAVAYLLRGAHLGCRSLAQARATRLGGECERGLLLGAAETLISTASIVTPYVAGWLYASHPTYPLLASAGLLPLTMLLFALSEGPVSLLLPSDGR